MIAARRTDHPPDVDWLAIAPVIALGGAARPDRAGCARCCAADPRSTPVALVLAVVGVVVAAGGMLSGSGTTSSDDGADHHDGGHGARRRASPCSSASSSSSRPRWRCCSSVGVPAARGARSARVPRARCCSRRAAWSMMTTANDLIVVFLALEILSIPLYVLAAFDRRRLSSQEAGIKYFVLGAFSSAIFLYGIALVYGATGTTSLTGIAEFLAQNTLFEHGHAARRARAAARRPRLQGRGGAVPHVDARRVPGRARRRSPRSWRRPPRPPAFAALLRVFDGRVPAVPRRLAPGRSGRSPRSRSRVGSVGAVRADRRQAPARVLVDRARGLRAHGRSRRRRRKGREAALFYLFVYTFMVDRLVRGRHACSR